MNKIILSPFTFLLHIALAVIMAGAIITHFWGIQGTLSLTVGSAPVSRFDKSSGPGDGTLPFTVALDSCEIVHYPGTVSPMDYRSHIDVGGQQMTVAMNRVAEVDGWRFYQSGIGADSSVLAISHDPVGIAVTYTGYALLFIGMIGFFFQKRTLWRAMLRNKVAMSALFLLMGGLTANAADDLPTMQRPLAKNFGEIYVYWNDRVSPLQTMALDVTSSLYGSTSYRGLTAEQVLAGWLFYYDAWMRDYDACQPIPKSEKERKKDEEKRALIQWIGSGAAFKIYPYKAATGRMEWLSLSERRPSKMGRQQWKLMLRTMPEISRLIHEGKNIKSNELIKELREHQRIYAGLDALPSEPRFKAEVFYNRYIRIFPVAILLLLAGAFGIWSGVTGCRIRSAVRVLAIVSILSTAYLALILILRGWIGAHWPLSNGMETMLFMAFVSCLSASVTRSPLICGALLSVGALASLVACMAGRTPQIGSLMPVLASPLLSVHVMLVMCSYMLFFLMAMLSAVALIKKGVLMSRMERVNRILLTPAVFLLAAGIFIGAVWANNSWGRYWGWDPKETCALITLLIYALPVHRVSIRCFRHPKVLHFYLLFAVLSVVFTYFGANYLLPGLHSYA